MTAEVGDIIDINSYIRYAGSATIFDYCKDGVISDGVIVETGDIVVKFNVALNDSSDKIRNHLSPGATSLSVKTSFITSDVPALSPYLESVSFSVSDVAYTNGYLSASSSGVTDAQTYVSDFTTTTGLDASRLYFQTKYSFKFPVGDEFNSKVYSKLSKGKIVFDFKAVIL